TKKWKEQWGGLLVDPKGTLLAEVRDAVNPDIYSIGPKSKQGVNLLRCHLKPRDLGVALTLAAKAAGMTSSEAYWTNELKSLFGAGIQLLSLTGQPITLKGLADLFLGVKTAKDKTVSATMDVAFYMLREIENGLSAQDQQRGHAAETILRGSFLDSKGENA